MITQESTSICDTEAFDSPHTFDSIQKPDELYLGLATPSINECQKVNFPSQKSFSFLFSTLDKIIAGVASQVPQSPRRISHRLYQASFHPIADAASVSISSPFPRLQQAQSKLPHLLHRIERINEWCGAGFSKNKINLPSTKNTAIWAYLRSHILRVLRSISTTSR